MTAELSIFSKKTLLPDGIREATLLINDGKISEIIEGKAPPGSAKRSISAGESVLMPGLIDCHVHINEPGRTDWEGFETATKAAAAGGVTTLTDMPLNSFPATTSVEALREKLKSAEGKLFINCSFWGGIIPGNSKDIGLLAAEGVMGFKAFLCPSGIEDFPFSSINDLEAIADKLRDLKLPVLVHAELEEKHKGLDEFVREPYSYQAFLGSRPPEWEDNAIKKLIQLAGRYNLRIHIVHLSSSSSLAALKKAREEGIAVTVETCPHYLFFNAESIHDADPRFKCTPPIRSAANNSLLWDALKEGVIDFIVSDHSPAPPELKHLSDGNLLEAWGGIASLQFGLPIIWTLARKDQVSLEQLSRWMSSNIADFLKLPSKGRIQQGADADLVIWNPEKQMKVSKALIKYRHQISPYEECMLYGLVEKTFVGGTLVYDKGAFVSSPSGKIIVREK